MDLTNCYKNIINSVKIVFRTLFIFLFFTGESYSQPPTWVAGTPSVSNVGPLSVQFNYGLNKPGTVYVIIFNSNVVVDLTPNQVKTWALAGPSGGRVVATALTVAPGQENTTLSIVFDLINAGQPHAFYCVAESTPGGLQADDTRINAPPNPSFTTLPCPKIDILTGFSQPVTCVNKGASATFQVVLIDPPSSGILKGTQWTIDWGDGTPVTSFKSSADYEIPPLVLRQHVYSTATSCNYVFTNTVRNPCGETRSVQYVAVVHGRDIPSDGDGILQIVDNVTGNTTVQVCEGTQTIVTIRDNSTWNCQNPTLPGGLTPVPNNDTRNIEWLYGIDPLGTVQNTITGTVSIAGLGNAPQASGRITPSPYGPSSLSQAITIPATCKAGEYFRVYLKNWNRCNWTDPEYVSTYI